MAERVESKGLLGYNEARGHTMSNPSLVILAAGMGSRYGGLKQIDAVGSNHESIIDFTIYDAIQAGFKKVYLIIRREHEAAFEKALTQRIRPFIDVAYIFQDMQDLPDGFSAPSERVKPWGTTHALWAARHHVREPFMICNADDYYGKEAFKTMHHFLTTQVSDTQFSLMGYRLGNTLSDSGAVTRGVCEVRAGRLVGIVERSKIMRDHDRIIFVNDEDRWETIDAQHLVSMNFWGFTPAIFTIAEQQLSAFLRREISVNPLSCEHVLPTMIGETLASGAYTMHTLASENTWFGVTYQEDKPAVVAALQSYKQAGLYPFDLWAN
jgi:NDP-sugar pyrophosphorylase family protein